MYFCDFNAFAGVENGISEPGYFRTDFVGKRKVFVFFRLFAFFNKFGYFLRVIVFLSDFCFGSGNFIETQSENFIEIQSESINILAFRFFKHIEKYPQSERNVYIVVDGFGKLIFVIFKNGFIRFRVGRFMRI